jgi:hypothetical protein
MPAASTADQRTAVIDQAVAYIDSAPADLAAVLARTSIYDHLKADPAALRGLLADKTLPVQPAYRAARQVLDASKAGLNTAAGLLADARDGDLAKALAAGTAAMDIMGTTDDPLAYSDAGGALGAAFDTVRKILLAADPDLAAAVARHAHG